MDLNLRHRIWPEYTNRWFLSKADSNVPHNFYEDDTDASHAIKQYLLDHGLRLPKDWQLDNVFHNNMKHWIGGCSVAYHTLEGRTSTKPFYLSFFPFLFEVGSAAFLDDFESFITRPDFLKFGDSMLIRPEKPEIVQLCMNGILERLLNFNNPKYGFIYKVLINKDNQSNIENMGFEESGDFWLRFKIGLSDQAIDDINNPHANIVSDRSSRIREMKTYLESADSFFKLVIEKYNQVTYLRFRRKTTEELNVNHTDNVKTERNQDKLNSDIKENTTKGEKSQAQRSSDESKTVNKKTVFNSGNFSNTIIGDGGKQKF